MLSSNTSAVSGDANYIEDVFSTYLYTGNGASQTITNGIDLAGKGGLVWVKSRSAATSNYLGDTARGINKRLTTNTTDASTDDSSRFNAFNSNGFDTGTNLSTNAATFASWTFRKQPKFFDVVTYTGAGGATQTISHNLGSTPGCVIVKRTDQAGGWDVWHQSISNKYLQLQSTAAAVTVTILTCNSTSITFQDSFYATSGASFVVYIFAHDAGGFGLTGTDNVISCGSISATGGVQNTVNLGYEPQYVLIKGSDVINNWQIIDTMRGLTADTGCARLLANTSGSETTTTTKSICLTSTGFTIDPSLGGFNGTGTYIYIAIRRGPMKVPTDATKVYKNITRTEAQALTDFTFPADHVIMKENRAAAGSNHFFTRLSVGHLDSESTASESGTSSTDFSFSTALSGFTPSNNSFIQNVEGNSTSKLFHGFRRAPSFFDVVCYTGTGAAASVTHNLGVSPELVIVKSRSDITNWETGVVVNGTTYALTLDRTNSSGGTAPFSAVSNTTFTTTSGSWGSGQSFVAYLFATCVGVSKVGSYTGNGSSQTISCGFAAGARFILIKRTDSSGAWYVWDTARGIVAGNDPHLSLNTTAAEVTTNDSIDPDSSGFIVNQVAATNVNVNAATYIFLAIA